jgi:hypothetical protein
MLPPFFVFYQDNESQLKIELDEVFIWIPPVRYFAATAGMKAGIQ